MINTNTEKQGRKLIDPTGHKKIILTIDGGGMRGAITLAMLAALEERSGIPSYEMFDMFVGTSTGAIIAGGLAIGYSAKTLLEDKQLYSKLLPKAFNQKLSVLWLWAILIVLVIGIVVCILSLLNSVDIFSRIVGFAMLLVLLGLSGIVAYLITAKSRLVQLALRIVANSWRFAYPLQPFLDVLLPLVIEKNKALYTVSDLEKPILLATTKDVVTGETNFIVNAGKGKAKFADWPLSAAIAASGAAPIFFPLVASRFTDGGVGLYGNPCFIAAVEAMEYIGADEGFTDGNVILVSLGTGYPSIPTTTSQVDTKNFFDWMQYVISESLDDALHEQVSLTRQLYGDRGPGKIDFRRFNPLLTKDNIEKQLGIKESRFARTDPTELGLDSFGDDEVALMEAIGKAYGERINWSRENAMPWDVPDEGGQPDPRTTEADVVDWQVTPFKRLS